MPFSFCSRTNSSMIVSCTDTSRALVASSQTIISGSNAKALAIATRCRCPPLILFGYRSAKSSGKSTIFNNSLAFASTSALLMRSKLRNGSQMMSRTFIFGLKAAVGSWNTIWI